MKKKILNILNALIRRGYWFNNMFFQDCRKFYTYKQFDTDVVNLGSTSAVHAFNYSGIEIKCANWALSRNPLLGDYAILRNYSSFLKKDGATVIFTLCPFSFLAGGYDYFDDRYYSILYPSTIPSFSYIHNTQVRDKVQNPILYYPWYALFVDVWRFFFPRKKVTATKEFMIADADNRFNGWCKEFSIKDLKNQLSLNNTDGINDALKIIQNVKLFCAEHNLRFVLVVPPVYRSLADKFTNEVKYCLIDSILGSEIFKDIEVYDYLASELFSDDISLFENSFILNEKGAKLFTRHILHELNLI